MSTTLASEHDPIRRARLSWIVQVLRQPAALGRQALRARQRDLVERAQPGAA